MKTMVLQFSRKLTLIGNLFFCFINRYSQIVAMIKKLFWDRPGMKLYFLLFIVITMACKPEPEKPNIIFILSDDLGYGDLSGYNSESLISTPNLDRLASEGISFMDAHSPSAVCTPTRYGLLTGRYAWRTWLKRGVVGGYSPPLIETDRVTLGSFLKGQDYTTAAIGKWHLGLSWTRANGSMPTAENAAEYWAKNASKTWQDGDPSLGENIDFSIPPKNGPWDLGFDYSFITSACSTIDGPFSFIENGKITIPPTKMIEIDSLALDDYKPRPGWVSPDYDIETVDLKFTDKALNFISKTIKKDSDKPFFVYLALSSPHAPWLPPELTENTADEGPRGDLVALVDYNVGRILDYLKDNNLDKNTLVIFTSDNGPRHGANGHASSGKLRGYKSHIWEGGHRIPFIAKWPDQIPAGVTSSEMICLTDMMATFAGMLNVKLDKGSGPDSYDIFQALIEPKTGRTLRPNLVAHSEDGTFAIRKGFWKLIMNNKTSGGWVEPEGQPPFEGSPGQLYNLSKDPYEQNDLWDINKSKVEELEDLFEEVSRSRK